VKTSFALAGLLALLALGSGCSSAADTTSGADDAPQVSDLTSAIDVQPYAVVGSGRPGSGAEDIDAPDGLTFDSNGSLLLTDAANHRVQIWSVVGTPKKLGEVQAPAGGEVVDLAVSPVDGRLIVTDEDTHLAYGYEAPKKNADGKVIDPAAYTLKTSDLFRTEVVKKVGGITFDSHGRIYTVDANQNLVRRYKGDGTPDPTFEFAENGGVSHLNGCEGIAVDEKRGNLYVSSEFTSAIQVFDLETGAPKNKIIGRKNDAANPGTPTGKSVFSAAIEGLWILDDYLLASDEADGGEGHVLIFDLASDSIFDHDADDWAQMTADGKKPAFVGGFGKFLSPDSVAAFTDVESGESYVAVADQGHYQVAMYKWSEITRAGKFGRRQP
jgi:DNA-binding beta-propeller fold protein YncE